MCFNSEIHEVRKGGLPFGSCCGWGHPRSGELEMNPRRYLTIYGELWKNSVVREMGFKANFLLWIVTELLWFALQLTFITVIYRHTDHIGDWSKWEVVLLMGASHFIQQIFQALFLTNVTQLSELIRTGKLDVMLLLPVLGRFIISWRQAELGCFLDGCSLLAMLD